MESVIRQLEKAVTHMTDAVFNDGESVLARCTAPSEELKKTATFSLRQKMKL